ncbi:MAG: ATP-binding protein [Marinobacter sp.]|uniref:ATP-binding protein n=1 Tax=Marinobacter sp. TaxID=50741 RepID=UPI00299EDAE8|nr:ATP-binding protein [Marinobacter sp.]MDX1756609.1 ATP-binding protein [Marinobacter sp.]
MSSRIEVDVQQSLDGVLAWLSGRLQELGVASSLVHDCKVIVDEYVANLNCHGRGPSALQVCSLEVLREADDLVLRFQDDGARFDPTSHDATIGERGIDDRPVGGLGILLIKELSDGLDYRYCEGHNCLDIKIHLTRGN